MKKSFVQISVIVVIVSAFCWQCIGAWQDSQTTDEAVHLTAGRSYWQTWSYDLNPEHPALFKLWAALPLAITPKTAIDTDTDVWQQRNQWTIGAHYLYFGHAQQNYNGRFLLFVGRFQMILVWLALVITLSVFSWRRWGQWPSLAVTTMIAYDPNLLGHGHLVTNDVAASLAFFGTALALHHFIRRPSWSSVRWLSLIFAIAQVTKFSMAILWILVPLMLIIARWYRQPGLTWTWVRRAILTIILMTSLVTWAVYGFRINRIANDTRIARLWTERQEIVDRQLLSTLPKYTQRLVKLADPVSPTGKFLDAFQHFPLPSYWYWRGFFSAFSHNVYGHGAYLLGQVSMLGWWYYFPVAILVKTPVFLLISVIGVVALWIYRLGRGMQSRLPFRQLIPFEDWVFGFLPFFYLLWSMTSHINLGLRHVFPTYIFFPLAAGCLIAYLQRRQISFVTPLVSILCVMVISITTIAWPNTIGYYNGLIGGTNQGHKYILDSNLDWNQDIWRLRHFLDQEKFSKVHIALFGSIPSDRIFPELLPILRDTEISQGISPTGVIAISQGQLYNVDGPFGWLRKYQPRWRVGSSINVYDFR